MDLNLWERRQKILEVLCLRRHDTYGNLAHEFNVSTGTIRRDIVVLTCSYPIEPSRAVMAASELRNGFTLTAGCSMRRKLLYFAGWGNLWTAMTAKCSTGLLRYFRIEGNHHANQNQ